MGLLGILLFFLFVPIIIVIIIAVITKIIQNLNPENWIKKFFGKLFGDGDGGGGGGGKRIAATIRSIFWPWWK